jgi:hypothetical protein
VRHRGFGSSPSIVGQISASWISSAVSIKLLLADAEGHYNSAVENGMRTCLGAQVGAAGAALAVAGQAPALAP